jgi:hypothetical protein
VRVSVTCKPHNSGIAIIPGGPGVLVAYDPEINFVGDCTFRVTFSDLSRYGSEHIISREWDWHVQRKEHALHPIFMPLGIGWNQARRDLYVPYWLLLIVVSPLVIWSWWRDRRRFPRGRCCECGYNLTGNVSGVCPECGMAVTAAGA